MKVVKQFVRNDKDLVTILQKDENTFIEVVTEINGVAATSAVEYMDRATAEYCYGKID